MLPSIVKIMLRTKSRQSLGKSTQKAELKSRFIISAPSRQNKANRIIVFMKHLLYRLYAYFFLMRAPSSSISHLARAVDFDHAGARGTHHVGRAEQDDGGQQRELEER